MLQKLEAVTQQYKEVLSRDQIAKLAPSVFAKGPSARMKEKYRFVPTVQVLDALVNEGFYPVLATQKRSRAESRVLFTRHMIRLRHHSFMENMQDEIPELVLMNSHDGTSSYQLMAGIFRLVCSNGLVVASHQFGTIRAKHTGSEELLKNIIDASYQIVESVPTIMEQVERFKETKLNKTEQLAYATDASKLRPTKLKLDGDIMLNAIRDEDLPELNGKRDLWTTYNVVQEKLITGAPRIGLNVRGRPSNLRPLNNLQQSVNTNKQLWQLTEQYAAQAA